MQIKLITGLRLMYEGRKGRRVGWLLWVSRFREPTGRVDGPVRFGLNAAYFCGLVTLSYYAGIIDDLRLK